VLKAGIVEFSNKSYNKKISKFTPKGDNGEVYTTNINLYFDRKNNEKVEIKGILLLFEIGNVKI